MDAHTLMSDVKVGDILADVSYVRVVAVNPPHCAAPGAVLLVEDLYTRHQFYVRGSELINHYSSADWVTAIQRISLTEMAERLVHAGSWPFTVTYVKANKERRVLRGKLVSTEPLLGRSLCEDFDIEGGERLRLVDHRTLQRLVMQGIEYRVKR